MHKAHCMSYLQKLIADIKAVMHYIPTYQINTQITPLIETYLVLTVRHTGEREHGPNKLKEHQPPLVNQICFLSKSENF